MDISEINLRKMFEKKKLKNELLEKKYRAEFTENHRIESEKEKFRRTAYDAANTAKWANENKRREEWLLNHNEFIKKEMQRREIYEKKMMSKNTDSVKEINISMEKDKADRTVVQPYSLAPSQNKEWEWPNFDDN